MSDLLNDADMSLDSLLKGRLRLWQFKSGFRVGLDTVVLASAASGAGGGAVRVLELGAGVGGVSLSVAMRHQNMMITAVEKDPMLVAALERNIALNGLGEQVSALCADALGGGAEWHSGYDLVLMNPPYHAAGSTPSPSAERRRAKSASDLRGWLAAGRDALKPKGRLTLITSTGRVAEVIATLASDFGEITLLPIYPRPLSPTAGPSEPLSSTTGPSEPLSPTTGPSEPLSPATGPSATAKRTLISARLGVKGGSVILPPLILHRGMTGQALSRDMAAIEDGQDTIAQYFMPHFHAAPLK